MKREKLDYSNYSDWFSLYTLCKYAKKRFSIEISSVEFGELLNMSQQTASRRIQDLGKRGWIRREIDGKTQRITITEKGCNVLFKIFENLKEILDNLLLVGEVTEGMGEGAYYVAIKGYYQQFKDKLGFEPYKGTLNLKLNDTDISILREIMSQAKPVKIKGFENQERRYGPVYCYEVEIAPMKNRGHRTNAAILDIKRTHHKENIVEILAEEYLRDYFELKDGEKILIKVKNNQD
ncbi:MAG: Riboflavin kinase [Promethearchaeota archaeon]|nr:MAG: Riboflavin kinase [Candidatus Lokiarchaeota archaeon]